MRLNTWHASLPHRSCPLVTTCTAASMARHVEKNTHLHCSSPPLPCRIRPPGARPAVLPAAIWGHGPGAQGSSNCLSQLGSMPVHALLASPVWQATACSSARLNGSPRCFCRCRSVPHVPTFGYEWPIPCAPPMAPPAHLQVLVSLMMQGSLLGLVFARISNSSGRSTTIRFRWACTAHAPMLLAFCLLLLVCLPASPSCRGARPPFVSGGPAHAPMLPCFLPLGCSPTPPIAVGVGVPAFSTGRRLVEPNEGCALAHLPTCLPSNPVRRSTGWSAGHCCKAWGSCSNHFAATISQQPFPRLVLCSKVLSMYQGDDGMWRLAFRVANLRQHQARFTPCLLAGAAALVRCALPRQQHLLLLSTCSSLTLMRVSPVGWHGAGLAARSAHAHAAPLSGAPLLQHAPRVHLLGAQNRGVFLLVD